MDRIGVIDLKLYTKPVSDGCYLSYNEFQKIKPRPKSLRAGIFLNLKLWIDSNGNLYEGSKGYIGNEKRHIEEFKEFGGNENAVCVTYTEPLRHIKHWGKWFQSEQEFLSVFEKIKEETPASFETPNYKINKRGYTKIPPKDRKTIRKLPYFDIDNFPKKAPGTVAWYWVQAYSDFFTNTHTDLQMLETVVEAYQYCSEQVAATNLLWAN